eukprot:20175-Amphidinium_carterae.1
MASESPVRLNHRGEAMLATSPKKSARKQQPQEADSTHMSDIAHDSQPAVRFQNDNTLREDVTVMTHQLSKLDVLLDMAQDNNKQMKELVQANRGLTDRLGALESLVHERSQYTAQVETKVDTVMKDLAESKLQWQKSVAELRDRLSHSNSDELMTPPVSKKSKQSRNESAPPLGHRSHGY